MNATAIEAMPVTGSDPRAWWKKVVEVKIAVLVRGGNAIAHDRADAKYDLFGEPYSAAFASRDKGARILVSELSKSVRNRARKVFTSTVWLRNWPGESKE